MRNLFLCSHGSLAEGLCSAIKMLTGVTDKLHVFGLYPGMHSEHEIVDKLLHTIIKDDGN